MKNYESLADALDDLRKRGYETEFDPQPSCLYCDDLDLRLIEEEFHIDEAYRFEEGSNATDTVIVYAISSATGLKGIIVDEAGSSKDNTSFEMAKSFNIALS